MPNDATFVYAEPTFVHAMGDEQQVVVSRSPLVRDDDTMLYPVREHVERFGMVLVDRRTRPDPGMMFGQCEMSWYAVPQARLGLLTHTNGKLPLTSPSGIE